MNKGKFFVIDGTDGSGKGTQYRLTIKRLKEEGYDIMEVDFPQYGKKSASLVEQYLNGEFGDFDEVNAYQASIFYACDRFAASKNMKAHLEKGSIILANRYVSSNQIHQSSKIKDKKELDKFLTWLDDLEFNIFKIPKPQKVIFLNMPYKIGQELVKKKPNEERNYIKNDSKVDIHEASEIHMSQAYNRACELVDRYDYWTEVKSVDLDGNLRTIEDIQREVYSLIKKEL